MKKWIMGISCIVVMVVVVIGSLLVRRARQGEVSETGKNLPETADRTGEAEHSGEDAFSMEGYEIYLDAGHGGFDPGKIGINQAKEKDINLAVVLKLAEKLKKVGFSVRMTRTEDAGLYEEGSSHKKREDMNHRVTAINESDACMAVSIHQNSFTQQSSKGAQVFYHEGSEEGKKLAEVLQGCIKEKLADGNNREAKANNSYYLLTHTECPTVIVECGFLSNPEEAALLVTEEYQEKMAEAVCAGILEYMSGLGQ